MRSAAFTLAVAAVCVVAAPTASAESACEALGGTVDATVMCRIHEVGAGYERTASFPIGYPDQQAVADFLTQDRAGFVDWVGKFGTGAVYEEKITPTVRRAAGTQSLVFEIQDPTGFAHEAHPDIRFKTFTTGPGGPVTIDTLFVPGTDVAAVVGPLVQPALNAHEVTLADPDSHSYRNFALTDEAVTFYFGESQLRPVGNAPRVIEVPRTALAGLLRA